MSMVYLRGFFMAIVLGISSPKRICTKVRRKNDNGNAIASIHDGSDAENIWNTLLRISATVSWPIQPMRRPILVIASCVAERYLSRWVEILWATFAVLLPSLALRRSWDCLTLTIANSAITKNALHARIIKTITIHNQGSISSKNSIFIRILSSIPPECKMFPARWSL